MAVRYFPICRRCAQEIRQGDVLSVERGQAVCVGCGAETPQRKGLNVKFRARKVVDDREYNLLIIDGFMPLEGFYAP